MTKYCISIISQHTIPNYLIAKERELEYDKHLFVTTPKMEAMQIPGYLEHMLADDGEKIPRVIVSEDNYYDILAKLEGFGFAPDDKFIVNLTGGTKIMTLAVSDFFSKFQSEYCYVPIGKNSYSDLKGNEIPIHYRVNLAEYLYLYGFNYDCVDDFYKTKEEVNRFFERFKNVNFNRYRMSKIRDAHQLDDQKERSYYSGEWFEEYVYHRVKDQMELADDQIGMSVKIFRGENIDFNENELDVAFVNENKFYVIECKVSLGKSHNQKANLESYLYKLAAIAKDKGLVVNSYIATLSEFNNNENLINETFFDNLKNRQRILGVKGIFDCNDFTNPIIKF